MTLSAHRPSQPPFTAHQRPEPGSRPFFAASSPRSGVMSTLYQCQITKRPSCGQTTEWLSIASLVSAANRCRANQFSALSCGQDEYYLLGSTSSQRTPLGVRVQSRLILHPAKQRLIHHCIRSIGSALGTMHTRNASLVSLRTRQQLTFPSRFGGLRLWFGRSPLSNNRCPVAAVLRFPPVRYAIPSLN